MKSYDEMRDCIRRFLDGELTRIELIAAFGLWQRSGAPL
jgi:hypothetical protein